MFKELVEMIHSRAMKTEVEEGINAEAAEEVRPGNNWNPKHPFQ